MYLAKLNEIERKKLFIKIITWSEKLSDNKVIYFLLFWFNLLFYSQNMYLYYVFGYIIFYSLKLKLKKNVLLK